jgi:hypothetical protein
VIAPDASRGPAQAAAGRFRRDDAGRRRRNGGDGVVGRPPLAPATSTRQWDGVVAFSIEGRFGNSRLHGNKLAMDLHIFG